MWFLPSTATAKVTELNNYLAAELKLQFTSPNSETSILSTTM